MPVCISDARPGGKIRYEWSDGKGRIPSHGRIIELEPYSRIVHVERMTCPIRRRTTMWSPLSTPDGAGTLMTMRMTLPEPATRAMMLASGMEHGMEASYVRLQGFINSAAFV